jgi:CheY-like chemotaxis protein
MQILVVDDDEVIRDSLTAFLISEGHACEAVADGRAALVYLERRTPDVVITDLSMPEMGGLQLVRELREKHEETLNIVIITAFARESEIRAAQALAPVCIIHKPLRAPRLRSVLESITAKEKSAPPRASE